MCRSTRPTRCSGSGTACATDAVGDELAGDLLPDVGHLGRDLAGEADLRFDQQAREHDQELPRASRCVRIWSRRSMVTRSAALVRSRRYEPAVNISVTIWLLLSMRLRAQRPVPVSWCGGVCRESSQYPRWRPRPRTERSPAPSRQGRRPKTGRSSSFR